jgi:chromosomal replication initiator protein
MHTVITEAAALFGVDARALTNRSRLRHIVEARQAAAYALRARYPSISLSTIGALLGGRDHTTIIYALRAAERRAVHQLDYALKLCALRSA